MWQFLQTITFSAKSKDILALVVCRELAANKALLEKTAQSATKERKVLAANQVKQATQVQL